MGWQIDFDKKVGEMVFRDDKLIIYDSNGFMAVFRKTRYNVNIRNFLIINDDHMASCWLNVKKGVEDGSIELNNNQEGGEEHV